MALYDRDYMRDEPPTFGERLRSISAFHWFFWTNIVVFVVQWGSAMDVQGRFIPAGGVSIEGLSNGEVWTPFTYMFVHGSVGHILLNMMMLWFAGKRVQDLYGSRHFALIYILSGLMGAALQIVLSTYIARQPDAYLLGASASILGLLLAYAVAMPEEEIYLLLMFVIPVRFRLWGLAKFMLISNLALGCLGLVHALPNWLSGGGAPVAYLAHFGGAIAGWYYARTLGYGGLPANFETPASTFKPARHPAMANTRRRAPVVELDEEAILRDNPRKDPVVDLMRHEVDPILDKINDFGFNSLTDDERRTLERASRQMTKKGKI
jgi:membrane associated rhomboid family serine protease